MAAWWNIFPPRNGSFLFQFTVDQLMFAAINVRVLANWSISPAINVRDGSYFIQHVNCPKAMIRYIFPPL